MGERVSKSERVGKFPLTAIKTMFWRMLGSGSKIGKTSTLSKTEAAVASWEVKSRLPGPSNEEMMLRKRRPPGSSASDIFCSASLVTS